MPAADLGNADRDPNVRGAGERVTLRQSRHVVGRNLESLRYRHRRFVDTGKSESAAVWRPPIPCAAIHLLLRDEFGHSVLDDTAAIQRQTLFAPAFQVVDVQILVRT